MAHLRQPPRAFSPGREQRLNSSCHNCRQDEVTHILDNAIHENNYFTDNQFTALDKNFAFDRLLDAMDPEKMFSDNALVTVADFGGRYFAMCETPFMLEVNLDTLEIKERVGSRGPASSGGWGGRGAGNLLTAQ